MRAELLANAIDKELDPSTAWADVNVKVLAIGEEFSHVTEEEAPAAAPLVKAFRSDVLQLNFTPWAGHRGFVTHHVISRDLNSVRHQSSRRS